MRMQEMEISDYARQLFEAHGDKAIAEAKHNYDLRQRCDMWRSRCSLLELQLGAFSQGNEDDDDGGG